MARAILLTFKENDAAEAFIRKVLAAEQRLDGDGVDLASIGTVVVAYGKIEWVVAQPTVWCKCRSTGRGRIKGWTRTKKFGWFVHDQCNRPSFWVVRDFIRNLRGGPNDLLPGILAEHKADVHIMPDNEHIKAGVPARHDHEHHVLEMKGEEVLASNPSPSTGSDTGSGTDVVLVATEPEAGSTVQGSHDSGTGDGRLAHEQKYFV